MIEALAEGRKCLLRRCSGSLRKGSKMTKSKPGTTSFDEALAIKVAKWIHGRDGFYVQGERKGNSLDAQIGIPRLMGLWTSYPTVIQLRMESSDNWVMEVFGSAVLERCKKLAEALAVEFRTHLHVKLVQESVGSSSMELYG